jgi:hypothetical protein
MSSYPVQPNSLVSQDPQAQNSTQANRAAPNSAPSGSALPQDTVTISAEARAQQSAAASETHPGTDSTPNKPASPAQTNQSPNSTRKG